MIPAFQAFLLLDILLEMRDRENARNKGALFSRWRCEDILVSGRPNTKGF